jgi:hypothetical protein
MSYFAHIKNGIVDNVISAEQDIIDSAILGDPKEFIKTSYNTHGGIHYGQDGKPDGGIALRANHASVGDIYDKENDVFYKPQPFSSWTISSPDWIWKPPVKMPEKPENLVEHTFTYSWSELNKTWYYLCKPIDLGQIDILYIYDNINDKWNTIESYIENDNYLWNKDINEWLPKKIT